MKKVVAIIAFVVTVTGVILLILSGQPNRPVIKTSINLGWIGPLSGSSASFGIANKRGVELAVEEINGHGGVIGHPINVVWEDDQGESRNSVAGFQKLTVINGADAVLVPLYQAFMTLAPIAEQQKLVLLDTVDTSEEIAQAGEYSFGIGIYDESIGWTMADFITRSLKKTPVALAYVTNDAFMDFVKTSFKARVKGNLNIAFEEGYGSSESDFRSMLKKIQASGAKVVVALGYDEVGFMLKQARELGVNLTFVASDTSTSKNLYQNAGGAAEGLYFTFWQPLDSAKGDAFTKAFRTKYNEEPEVILASATGYDATLFLATAMAQGSTSGAGLRDSLYRTRLNGLTGELAMDRDGIVRSIRESIFVIDHGQFRPIWEDSK